MIAPCQIAGTEYSAVATSSNVDVQVTVNVNSVSEESGIELAMFANGPCLEPFDPLPCSSQSVTNSPPLCVLSYGSSST